MPASSQPEAAAAAPASQLSMVSTTAEQVLDDMVDELSFATPSLDGA